MGKLLSLFEREPAPAIDGRRPRHYQQDAIKAALAGLCRVRSGLCVLPTGTGKTVVAAEIARQWDGRVLFLAEQRRILTQAQRKFQEWAGEEAGFDQAENRSHGERIVCGMRQTLANDLRLELLEKRGKPSLIIVDEAHHHAGKPGSEYRHIIDRYPEARVLGLTATPDRADKIGLHNAWDDVFYRYDIHEALRDGWLVDVRPGRPANWDALDLSKVKKKMGELDDKAIEAMLAGVVKEQAKAVVETCERLKSIVFCGRVETAHDLAEAINGIMGAGEARAIDGKMDDDEKDEILDGFQAGHIRKLVNVGIAVEGFDAPDTEAVVLTRPYVSHNGFVQRAGRGLRPLGTIGLDDCASAEERRARIAGSAKPSMLLVTFRYLPGRHTLVGVDDILGGKVAPDEKALAQELLDEGKAVTVNEALEKAREQLEAERRRRAEAIARAQAKAKLEWGEFNPFGALHMDMPDGEIGDTGEPPARASESMRMWLRHQGVRVPDGITKAQAQKLRGTLEVRKKHGLSVLGQIRWLAAHGVTEAHKWSYERARDVMRDMQAGGSGYRSREAGEEG